MFFQYKMRNLNSGEQDERIHYLCEDGIENSSNEIGISVVFTHVR